MWTRGIYGIVEYRDRHHHLGARKKDLNTCGSWGEDPLPCAPTVLYWTVGVPLHADTGGGERELRQNPVLLEFR